MREWSSARLERERLVRYGDLRPCHNAFIDTRNPGSEAKENFTIIGPGVAENPVQHVHISIPHGFNIGGARQPPGCVNSQHSHETAEVFVVHSGHWRFTLGESGEDAAVECGPGDVISLPTQMFRGFTCLSRHDGDSEPGFLFAVLGGDDPGRVLWSPYVFDMAEEFGLVLLENGELVDTAAGAPLPQNIRPMPRTSAGQVAALTVPSQSEAEALVVPSPAAGAPGKANVCEQIIGPAAPLNWEHGFSLERITLAPEDAFSLPPPASPEVLFMHQGEATLAWGDEQLTLQPGDTLSVPLGLGLVLASDASAVMFRVVGNHGG